MRDEIWIWDKVNAQWTGHIFYGYEGAEDYVLRHGGYERFDIFEKLS